MIEPISQLETPHKILLIEDDPNYARLVGLMLSDSGQLNCSIVHYKTLAEGIAFLSHNGAREIAAVLLDLSLPDSQGFETLGRLIRQFPNLNIIVLTGLDDKGLGMQAVRAGAQDFLVKGYFDDGQLSKALRYSIARNNILRRLEETQRIAHIAGNAGKARLEHKDADRGAIDRLAAFNFHHCLHRVIAATDTAWSSHALCGLTDRQR